MNIRKVLTKSKLLLVVGIALVICASVMSCLKSYALMKFKLPSGGTAVGAGKRNSNGDYTGPFKIRFPKKPEPVSARVKFVGGGQKVIIIGEGGNKFSILSK